MTSIPSVATTSEPLTLFAEDSPVRTSPWLDSVLAWLESQTYVMSCEEQLAEIRAIMGDWSHECECETHTYHGRPMLVVDEDDQPVRSGGGYFAGADGKRMTKETTPADWPKGHLAVPCGHCMSCRLSALGCGTIHIIDGQGARDVSLTFGEVLFAPTADNEV